MYRSVRDSTLEGEEKYLKEKEQHAETLSKLDLAKRQKEKIEKSVEVRAEKISNTIGKLLFTAFVLLFVFGTVVQFSPNFLNNQPLYRGMLILITVLLGLLSVATGFNLKGFRDKIKMVIKKRIIEYLIGQK